MAGTVVVDAVKSSTTGAPTFQNTSGTEIGQLCRAWVNFNGTGTVAIRAAFNVSSITDNGTGNYRVNFTNAMADGNYCATVTTAIDGTAGVSGQVRTGQLQNTGVMTTTYCDVCSITTNTTASTDSGIMCVSIFR